MTIPPETARRVERMRMLDAQGDIRPLTDGERAELDWLRRNLCHREMRLRDEIALAETRLARLRAELAALLPPHLSRPAPQGDIQ